MKYLALNLLLLITAPAVAQSAQRLIVSAELWDADTGDRAVEQNDTIRSCIERSLRQTYEIVPLDKHRVELDNMDKAIYLFALESWFVKELGMYTVSKVIMRDATTSGFAISIASSGWKASDSKVGRDYICEQGTMMIDKAIQGAQARQEQGR